MVFGAGRAANSQGIEEIFGRAAGGAWAISQGIEEFFEWAQRTRETSQ